jgi:hypothetical protein
MVKHKLGHYYARRCGDDYSTCVSGTCGGCNNVLHNSSMLIIIQNDDVVGYVTCPACGRDEISLVASVREFSECKASTNLELTSVDSRTPNTPKT